MVEKLLTAALTALFKVLGEKLLDFLSELSKASADKKRMEALKNAKTKEERDEASRRIIDAGLV